jgi:hypothetical protein
MQWRGLKIPVIIFSLLAGMAVIFGMQWLYQKLSFQEPLDATLEKNQVVESYQLSKVDRQYLIEININNDADLMDNYKEIHKEINHIMGKRSFELRIIDDSDDILNQVWYNSQYAVYQAVVQGNYQDMAAVVNREAEALGAEAEINLDRENIYFRIKHQGHALDKIIPINVGFYGNTSMLPAGGEDG